MKAMLLTADQFEDREVVVDENFVTSRVPADLPAVMREVISVVRGLREAPRA